MSYGLIPGPGALLAEKRVSAERKLGCTSTLPALPSPPADHLYKWADEIKTQLDARHDSNPKLTIARSLDIPSEQPRWLGLISTQRSTPRHRVIARFARERLWDQIWSLNWDCVQESAFENVGIIRKGKDELLPWPTVFDTFVTATDCATIGQTNNVKIIKPHGCVMALVEAEEAEKKGQQPQARQLSDRFLITASELANLAPTPGANGTQNFIFANLTTKLCTQPFIAAGWSVSETYLLNHIDANVRPALEQRSPLPVDELSIIDIVFNPDGHTRLAGFYGKNKDTAHICIRPIGFDLDQLFLWLQALYAVEHLSLWKPSMDNDAFTELTNSILQPPDVPGFVVTWVDNFLPVWVRLCWRSGLVDCRNSAGLPVQIHEIYLERRDEHIPWVLPNIDRPELKVAARLLSALHRSGNAEKWDFEIFPGGLYQSGHLVIPLPAWRDLPNDLRGLKTLLDAIKLRGIGYVNTLSLLFLDPDPVNPIPDERKLVLKELVARDLEMIGFAKGSNLNEIPLEGL